MLLSCWVLTLATILCSNYGFSYLKLHWTSEISDFHTFLDLFVPCLSGASHFNIRFGHRQNIPIPQRHVFLFRRLLRSSFPFHFWIAILLCSDFEHTLENFWRYYRIFPLFSDCNKNISLHSLPNLCLLPTLLVIPCFQISLCWYYTA